MLRPILFALILGFSLQSVEQPEDYPGQHQHALPPEGWYCSATAKDAPHKCQCKRMAAGQDCETITAEDPQCKVWCHADRCRCPVHCDVGHPHPTR